jgi:hypothetical protein
MKRLTSAILVFWMVFATHFSRVESATSYPANPLPAHTGGFGEKSCHTCHSDFEVNPPSGSLRVGWEHGSVQPGKNHTIKMSLAHAEMLRAGFQLTARFADGPDAGKQAGRFVPSDIHHVLTEQAGIWYLSQSVEGGKLTKPGTVDWTATWVAPPGRNKVVFHVSAVGGDEDGSQYGDWVYVTEFRPRR